MKSLLSALRNPSPNVC